MKRIVVPTLILVVGAILGASLTLIYFGFRSVGVVSPTNNPPNTQAAVVPFTWDTAPQKTLRGEIIALTGDVTWQSRTATAPSTVRLPQTLQQGESLFSGNDGQTKISFPNFAGITLNSQTQLNIIQTLPSDLVFSQFGGSAAYSASSSSPLTVRTGNLLVRLEKGIMSIKINDLKHTITVSVSSGSAQAAFNDWYLQTHLQSLSPGSTYLYNISRRQASLLP